MSSEKVAAGDSPAAMPPLEWQAALDALQESICLLGPDGRIVSCNRAAERLTGRQGPRIIGRLCDEVFGSLLGQQAECPGLMTLVTHQPFSGEFGADGRWYEVAVTPLPEGSGAVHRIADITARRMTERELQVGEERYRRLVESVTDYLYTVRVEKGRAIETRHGPGCVGVTGYSSEEFAADPLLWLHMVPEEDHETVLIHAARVLVDDIEGPLVHRIIHKDGSTRWVRNTPVPAHDREGRLVAYDGLVQNITAEKLAEQQVRQSEAFVRHILDAVDEAFIVVGRDYRIVTCNRAYLEQTGRPAGNCIGQRCHEVSHGSAVRCQENGEVCPVSRVFATGEPCVAVHDHCAPAGGLPLRVEIKAFPLRGPGGDVTGAIEVINNISDRVRLEEQLRQAQKMEAVGLLAGGVAHDFNNILSAIVGYGSLLEVKLPADSEHRPYVEQILTAGERATSLTQSLLAFSRKQVINPRPLDLDEVIRKVQKLLQRLLGEDIELRTALAAGGLQILADQGQLEQILLNLATNARDAMPGGGVLSVETSRFSMDEAFVHANGFGQAGPYAQITVSDTGTGMSAQVRARIFEPFFTTKEVGRGTGLGLAMVYGAVRQNQGYIGVDSSPARGTAFRIWFPLVSPATPSAAAAAAAETAPLQRGSGRILVVEDDPTVRSLLVTVLREYGYTVAAAADGEEAIARFEAGDGAFDLCILDVVMPRLNGRETCDRLRELRPGLKALFISGYTAEIIHKRGILEVGLHFLSKPVAPRALLAKVRELLEPG